MRVLIFLSAILPACGPDTDTDTDTDADTDADTDTDTDTDADTDTDTDTSAPSCAADETRVDGAVRTFCVRLDQLDVDQASGSLPDSAWGRVSVRYAGATEPLYLALAVDGVERVRLVPLLSSDGATEQVASIGIALGVDAGTDLSSAEVAVDLTLTGSPSATSLLVPVGVAESAVWSTIPGGSLSLGDPPTLVEGGLMVLGVAPPDGAAGAVVNPNLPNQESEAEGCGPTAVSNSLQFLDEYHELELGAEVTSLTTWNGVFGFTPGVGMEAAGWDWPTIKAEYMAENGIPIVTTETTDPAEAYEALGEHCDVELQAEDPDGGGHVAAMSAMGRTEDGRYIVEVKHDTSQGQEGGLVREVGVLDPATGSITGITWMAAPRALRNFVIECPQTGE